MSIRIKKPILGRGIAVRLLVAVAIAISMIGLTIDVHSAIAYPGTDFRNRVVGARLMIEGIDPYLFKWQPGLSENFYDPLDDPTELVSKLSVPPTVLTLHAAFAGLPYLQQKAIWLVVQWAAFAGTVCVFIRTSGSQRQKTLIWGVSFCFANSLFWRLHISSGQIYVVYTFILAIAWFFLQSKFRYPDIASGFFAGTATSLRPSFILVFVPFALRKQYSFLFGGAVGLLSSVAFAYWVAGELIWQRYILTMLKMIGLVDLSTYLPQSDSILPEPTFVYPRFIEGFDWDAYNPLERYFSNNSLYAPLNSLHVSNERGILILVFLAVAVYLSRCLLKLRIRDKGNGYTFLLGVLLCLLCDFFLPIPRYPYYDVQMLLPLLAIVQLADDSYLMSHKGNILLIAGLFLGTIGFAAVPKPLLFGGLLIMLYVLVTFVFVLRQSYRTNNSLALQDLKR